MCLTAPVVTCSLISCMMLLQAVARLLEAPNAERDAARLQASAAQWEYDDEYDDSFDDLAMHGNEGLADAEGEVLSKPYSDAVFPYCCM